MKLGYFHSFDRGRSSHDICDQIIIVTNSMLKDNYFAEEVTVDMAAADDPSVYQVSSSALQLSNFDTDSMS